MNIRETLEECTQGSENGRLNFPQVLEKLASVGVEQYHADLLRHEKTYYLGNGESQVVPSSPVRGTTAQQFSAPSVEAAVRASQAGRITYVQFCEQVIAAGCIGYLVSLPGRRVVYLGRTAESHVEYFPGSR
jgi:uncharacterized protein YbcV (DUF1398 family)